MVVAAAKLTIPTSRRALIDRTDLFDRLDTDYRVGLVSAPAGYGKTATLSSWAAGRRDATAWLSCDVYRKLGVAARADAVATGRALGVI